MKEIRCKKCNLTYNKKEKQCPYCKTKKPNKGILIFILLLLIISAIIVYAYSKGMINNIQNSTIAYIDGIKIELTDVKPLKDPYTNEFDASQINCYFDVTNVSNEEINISYEIIAYADDYKVSTSWLSYGRISEYDLTAGKKTKQGITVTTDNKDWQIIELYYSKSTLLSDEEHKKLFTINRSAIEDDIVTTTDNT